MDIRDRVKLASLLSEYGALLTEKQREMLSMYVEMDMSLLEVAAEYGVTPCKSMKTHLASLP